MSPKIILEVRNSEDVFNKLIMARSMRILFIDYLSYSAHKNFNRIHIEALLEMGHSLHLVGENKQFNNIEQREKVEISSLPSVFFKEYPFSPITYRIKWILCLIWIRLRYRLISYDLVIIPTYDPLSLFAYRSSKNTIVITHDVHYLDNRIKLFFVKLTPRHYIHIGLNESMSNHLKELLPDRPIFHIPHGICPPSNVLSRPSFLDYNDKFIFCPVNRWYDKQLINKTFNSLQLLSFLEKNRIKLVVKSQLIDLKDCSSWIVPVDNHLAKTEYDYLLDRAVVVLLPYEKNYMYRCSGIMFECVARNTPILASNIESMAIYKGYINILLFDNIQKLIEGIDYYNTNDLKSVDKTVFDPLNRWKEVFNSFSR